MLEKAICLNCNTEFSPQTYLQECCTRQCRELYKNKQLTKKWADSKPKPRKKTGFRSYPLNPKSKERT